MAVDEILERSAPGPVGEAGRVSFQVEPGSYRHWRLTFDGPVATLAMDVDEHGGLQRRLRAEAELLRPRRGHRALRRGAAAPVRAPRGAHGGADQRQGQDLLRGRQHQDAGRFAARVEGELLQVHQRDPQRHRGRLGQLRTDVPGGAERHGVRRRLRARAGVRAHHAHRRPLVRGVAAGTPAARGAARHRRADPGDRQAAGAPRSGRLLRDPVRGRRRGQGHGLAAGGRGGAAAAMGPGRRRARGSVFARSPARQPAPAVRTRAGRMDRADAAGQAARRRQHRLPVRDRGAGPAPARRRSPSRARSRTRRTSARSPRQASRSGPSRSPASSTI